MLGENEHGDLAGIPAAALSLSDGRVVADPFRRTDHLVASLRVHAGAMRAYTATPSLADRVRTALRAGLGRPRVAVPASS